MRIRRSPAARVPSPRLVAVALLLAGALVAAAVLTRTATPPGTVFDLGRPGEVRATYLHDGSPVFVVHALDGATHVVSAVAPSSQGLVTWCGDTRTFVETGGTSRWDEQGRYLFGPAEAGLALHRLARNPGGATVQAGARLRPRPVSDDPQPVSDEGRCYSTGGAGGLRHQRADMTAQSVEGAAGDNLARVNGDLVVKAGGDARLCSAAGCSSRSKAVTSTFHDTLALDEYSGVARGEFLVRVTPEGTFADLVDLDGVLRTLPMVGKPTSFSPADVTAELVEVTTTAGGPQLVMARPAEPRPVFTDGLPGAPPPSRTWPLADDATIVSLTTEGQYPFADFLTVAELQERIATQGPLSVEVHLNGDGVAVSLRPVVSTGR